MKTPDEIKKGLEYLATTDVTLKAKLAKRGLPYAYAEDVASDALAYIQQLEAKAPNCGAKVDGDGDARLAGRT